MALTADVSSGLARARPVATCFVLPSAFILPSIPQQGWGAGDLHSADEETEVQRGYVTCSKPLSGEGAEPAPMPRDSL